MEEEFQHLQPPDFSLAIHSQCILVFSHSAEQPLMADVACLKVMWAETPARQGFRVATHRPRRPGAFQSPGAGVSNPHQRDPAGPPGCLEVMASSLRCPLIDLRGVEAFKYAYEVLPTSW